MPPYIRTKSPYVAGLLGGVLGYGLGQYYAGRWISGTVFLVVDGFLTGWLIAGLTAEPDLDDRPPSGTIGEAVGEAVVWGFEKASVASIGAGGLFLSHAAQAVWGPIAVNRYNRDLLEARAKVVPLVDPHAGSIGIGICFRY